jgi:hypothetical protein
VNQRERGASPAANQSNARVKFVEKLFFSSAQDRSPTRVDVGERTIGETKRRREVLKPFSPRVFGGNLMKTLATALAVTVCLAVSSAASAAVVKVGPVKVGWRRPVVRPVHRPVVKPVVAPRPVVVPRPVYIPRPAPPKVIPVPAPRPQLTAAQRAAIKAHRKAALEQSVQQAVEEALQNLSP